MKQLLTLAFVAAIAGNASAQKQQSLHSGYPIDPVPFTSVKVTDSFWGQRLKANLTKAISCFTAASEQGYGKASYWLGRLHPDGIGQLEKDTQKAMNYYRKAIEQG